jgi:hypothetical protein
LIRILVLAAILVVAQNVSSYAEPVSLACTNSGGTFYIVFDLASRIVTDRDSKTYPIQIMGDQVSWQYRLTPGNQIAYSTYNRDSAEWHTWSDQVSIESHAKCMRGQKPPRPL